MSEDTRHWSCYTTPPERSLEMFEENRDKCPIPHSDEHDGFYMLLNYADVRSGMGDHKTYSSEPQVLRPMLPRKPIPARHLQRCEHLEDRGNDGAVRARGHQSSYRCLYRKRIV